MDKDQDTSGIQVSVKALEEEMTKVTGVDIEPVNNGWVVTLEYDDDEYQKSTFTNLEALMSFLKDMIEHPVRVPNGVARVRETK